MMLRKLFFSFALGLALLPRHSFSQTVEAVSRLSTDTIVIGQHAAYELNLKIPGEFSFEWPKWGDTLIENIEILNIGELQQKPLDADGNLWIQQEIVITAFDSGFYYLPGVELRFSPDTDSIFFVAQTNPLMFQVNSIDVDTAASFKPIKGPINAPIGFWEIFPWAIGLLGIALVIFVIVWFMVRKGKQETPIPVISKPRVPPHIIALNKLEELRQQKLWQAGKTKAYHSALSEIIRMYIEDRFTINAVEMTTGEILDAVELLGINEQAFAKFARSLQLGDLVKFAKAEPTGIENDLCLNHLVDFVNESHGLNAGIENEMDSQHNAENMMDQKELT